MKETLQEIKAELTEAYSLLSMIEVKGGSVDALAEARARLRKAFHAAKEQAAERAEDAIQHPALPDPSTGNWMVWDQVSESYQQTEPPVRAEGQDFEIKGYYPTLEALEAAVPEPEKGYAYGVGTEAPYDIYVWDKAHGVWVNNGPMTASGDMLRSIYDPQQKRQDIFAYADAAHVGKSMAGKAVEPEQGTMVTARAGAEIFNDYQARTYGTDEGYETIVPITGNIATGAKAHAEGGSTTATGQSAHAEGAGSTASGTASHAEGGRYAGRAGCIASAYGSHAEGVSTEASGSGAHAEGRGTKAEGIGAHSEGSSGIAEGDASHVEGGFITGKNPNKASGYAAHAEGATTLASGSESHAEGRETTASGDWSHAEGIRTVAANYDAHAEGTETQALATNSHAGGQGTLAEYFAETAIGRWNVRKSPTSSSPLGDLFVVGKGTGDTTRSNSFRVNHGGVYGTSAFNASGADYAELFEWADGNPENVDRVGRFVTLEGKSIRLAGPGDGYILGIVSGAPSVVGDVYDDQWQGMYLTDVFGRPVWEDVEVPAVTEEVPVTGPAMDENGEAIENSLTTHMETRVVIPAHTERRQKLNPDYDPNQPYVPRSERPEWDAVGMLGKLVAVDDGTCRADGWAAVGEGGEATASPERTRFRVMERIDARHVRILILVS